MCDSSTRRAETSSLDTIGCENSSNSEMRLYIQSFSADGFRVVPEGMLDMFYAPDDRRTAGTHRCGVQTNPHQQPADASFLGNRGNMAIVIFAK